MEKRQINKLKKDQEQLTIAKKENMVEKFLFSSFEFSNELLSNEYLDDALVEGMKMIGNVTKIDQIEYFKSHYNEESKKFYASQQIEWTLKDEKIHFNKGKLSRIVFEGLLEESIKP